MKFNQAVLLLIVMIAALTAMMSVFTVDQREQALVLQLGQPMGKIKGPGLHFKLPVVQEVRRFDRRILSVDPPPAQMVIASDRYSPIAAENVEADLDSQDRSLSSGEPIIVDAFARYRITDALRFMKSLRTIEAADQRIESIMNDATRTVLGKTTLLELLSTSRAAVMQDIRSRVNKKISDDELGIEIVDIRIVRADLTPELRLSTVRRMISELTERATETRSKGEERALQIRSTAEKERSVILAEAERDAQLVRGDGDKEAVRVYAAAFGQDKEFYSFLRSLEAYRNTMATPDTRLILSPDSEFLKYFKGGQ